MTQIDRQYLRLVYEAFPNHNRFYRSFYQSLKTSVRDYRSEHPHVSLEDIMGAFGTPEEISASCLEMYPEQSHVVPLWQKLFIVVAVFLIVLGLFLFSVYLYGLQNVHHFSQSGIFIYFNW